MENKNIHIEEMEPDGTVLLKYIRGESDNAEKAYVEDWLKEDEENEKTLEQIARIYYAVRTEERILSRDSQNAYNNVRKQIKGRLRKSWLNRMYVAAACFVGVLMLSTTFSYLWIQKNNNDRSQLVTVEANAGMRVHFTLPDGTLVHLNSGSVISYPSVYDKKERRINLSGEAYFNVTHNPEQPFIVNVREGKMQVRVLGTEFNLQAYKNENLIETTLVTGLVNIETNEQSGNVSTYRLKPSEKAVYDSNTGKMKIDKINSLYETAWKEGKLMFKDSPLPEVLRKITHFYNVRFEVNDSIIQTYRFTGTFENKQLFQILEYLKISSQIDYKIEYAKEDDSNGERSTVVVLRNKKIKLMGES